MKFRLSFMKNKAVYTASSVACFWAGAVTLLPPALKQSFCADSARFRTSGTDRPMDRPTDRPTDRVTYRVACTRLKNKRFWFFESLLRWRSSPIWVWNICKSWVKIQAIQGNFHISFLWLWTTVCYPIKAYLAVGSPEKVPETPQRKRPREGKQWFLWFFLLSNS